MRKSADLKAVTELLSKRARIVENHLNLFQATSADSCIKVSIYSITAAKGGVYSELLNLDFKTANAFEKLFDKYFIKALKEVDATLAQLDVQVAE